MRLLPALVLALLGACADVEEALPPLEVAASLDQVVGEGNEGDSTFGDVRGIAVDQSGRLYAVDGQAAAVRVFDDRGAFVRSLGRRGDGPGEFEVPQGVDVIGRRVFVYDGDGSRVAVFDTAGSLMMSTRIPVTSYGYLWRGGAVDSSRIADEQLVRADTMFRTVLRILDLADGSADTLPLPSCGYERPAMYQFPMGVAAVPFAAGGSSWIDVDGEATWCGHTGRAVVYRIAFGDSLPSDSLVSHAVPGAVSDSEFEAEVERLERFAQGAGGGTIDPSRIPRIKPVLHRVDRDPDGRMWMRVADSAGAAFHVFRPDGGVIARVRLPQTPSAHHPAAFDGDRVYLVGEDDAGAPVVRRYVVDLPDSP